MTWKRGLSPPLVPADAGTLSLPNNQCSRNGPWIPAFAGMSGLKLIVRY
jgi:hypothetical protein